MLCEEGWDPRQDVEEPERETPADLERESLDASEPPCDTTLPDEAGLRRLVEGMTEQQAHELLYLMRQRFCWYSEVFGRADIEERWDAEEYGPLSHDHLEAIIDRLERCDGYGAAERVSEIVDMYAEGLPTRAAERSDR